MIEDPGIDRWIASFRRRDPTLDGEEEAALRGVFSEVIAVADNRDIVLQHDRMLQSHLLLDGWAFRYITLEDGRRQIVAIHVPGDFVDLHSFPLQIMDHSVGTFSRCRIAVAPHSALRAVTERHPHLGRLFWLSTLIDAAIHRQWLAGGQRSALARAAHLLCELYVRLETVGEARDLAFAMPMSQVEFADALSISAVHTNRIVQELRTEGAVAWQQREVRILDWDRLAGLAEFDPTYLNLFASPR
ncbi:MAG: Crp/Fnr family transcriptional regulator [Pseudomonadota bacterium]